MKYQVHTPDKSGTYTANAQFSRRSEAIDYADQFSNVKVIRKTPQSTRTVFSRTITTANGFVTAQTVEVVRAPKAPAKV